MGIVSTDTVDPPVDSPVDPPVDPHVNLTINDLAIGHRHEWKHRRSRYEFKQNTDGSSRNKI